MKVGDLVRLRHPKDGDHPVALVVGTTNHPELVEILELSGYHKGSYYMASERTWKVVSESKAK